MRKILLFFFCDHVITLINIDDWSISYALVFFLCCSGLGYSVSELARKAHVNKLKSGSYRRGFSWNRLTYIIVVDTLSLYSVYQCVPVR